jgi:hypothetical protein
MNQDNKDYIEDMDNLCLGYIKASSSNVKAMKKHGFPDSKNILRYVKYNENHVLVLNDDSSINSYVNKEYADAAGFDSEFAYDSKEDKFYWKHEE